MPPKVPAKYPCIKCDQQVKEQEKSGSISCCVCERWIHAKCINIDKGLLAHFMNSHKTLGRHFWGCDGCTSGFYELTIRVGAMKEEIKAVKKTVEENTVKIDKVTDRVDKVEKQVAKDKVDLKQDKADIIREAGAAISRELSDRASRKSNIIIYNLPEPPLILTSGIERKNKDKDALAAVLSEIGVVLNHTTDIKFTVRTGELSNQVTARPRPLLVGLRTVELKDQVFASAKNLKGSSNFSRISIVPDLTRQQRNEDKALMDEAELKNSEMTEEEALNWEYRCAGLRGERTLIRSKINHNRERTGRRPVAAVTGANLVPLGTHRHRPDLSPRPSTSQDPPRDLDLDLDPDQDNEVRNQSEDDPGLMSASSGTEESEESDQEPTTRTRTKGKKKRGRSGTKSPKNNSKRNKQMNH